MEIKDRSVIFRADELNVVDMATGGQVADRYIQMASDIIFHTDDEKQGSVIRLIGPGFSGSGDAGLLHKGNLGQRLMP